MLDINLLTFFNAFTAGALWLLGVLFLFNVNGVNVAGNRWLGVFYCILACMFSQLFLENLRIGQRLLLYLLELPRWAMLPCFYMAIAYFVAPTAPKKNLVLTLCPLSVFPCFFARIPAAQFFQYWGCSACR